MLLLFLLAGAAPVCTPRDPAACHRAAIALAQSRQFAQAAAAEKIFAASDLADESAWSRVAALAIESASKGLALEAAQHAAAAQDTPANHRLLARAYALNAQPDQVIAELREVARRLPFDEAAQFDYANALLRQERFADAVTTLEKARATFDKSAQIELALGVAYYGQRRFTDAIHSFLRTIDLAPEVPQPYEFIARMIDQAGGALPEITRKFAAWNTAESNSALPPYVYAKALAAGNAPLEQCEKLLRESIARDPKFATAHFELGTLLERQRKWQDAAAELQTAVALDPKQADAHYHLARVYDRLGKTAKAAAEREVHAALTKRQ